MNNSISNVNFGAHLSLKNNNLYKHISREMANDFAKSTRDIKGIMKLKKDSEGLLEASYEGQSFLLLSDSFYSANKTEKVNTLKKSLRYIVELAGFDKIEKPTKKQMAEHVRKLDDIAETNESMSMFHDIVSSSIKDRI